MHRWVCCKMTIIHFYLCWPVYPIAACCPAMHSVFWWAVLTHNSWQRCTGGHTQKQKESFILVNMKVFQGHGALREETEWVADRDWREFSEIFSCSLYITAAWGKLGGKKLDRGMFWLWMTWTERHSVNNVFIQILGYFPSLGTMLSWSHLMVIQLAFHFQILNGILCKKIENSFLKSCFNSLWKFNKDQYLPWDSETQY